jgi:hypothetical protein
MVHCIDHLIATATELLMLVAISGQWQDLLSAVQPTVAVVDIRENGLFLFLACS